MAKFKVLMYVCLCTNSWEIAKPSSGMKTKQLTLGKERGEDRGKYEERKQDFITNNVLSTDYLTACILHYGGTNLICKLLMNVHLFFNWVLLFIATSMLR